MFRFAIICVPSVNHVLDQFTWFPCFQIPALSMLAKSLLGVHPFPCHKRCEGIKSCCVFVFTKSRSPTQNVDLLNAEPLQEGLLRPSSATLLVLPGKHVDGASLIGDKNKNLVASIMVCKHFANQIFLK